MKFKYISFIFIVALLCAVFLIGCGSKNGAVRMESNESHLSYSDAAEELDALVKKVPYKTVEKPVLDIYTDNSSVADNLADIDTFPLVVKGTGDIDIEIAAATEMTSDAPDDWLSVVARNFNHEKLKIGDETISVSVRKITSGEAVTYITSGVYQPNLFIPSNYAWGKMLEASGFKLETIKERIAGNTAGILIRKDVYDEFIKKYKEATVANILEASLNGDITFAYTNPYTSSTGLNILMTMLRSFDVHDPVSSEAAEKLLEYQKTTPPVAYTTASLRQSAAKGIINAMVMEEQAYINTPELKGYVYIPAGIRHDHPVYAFDWNEKKQTDVARLFAHYCISDASQKLATEKGFNRHDDYECTEPSLTGTDYLNAQKIWKQNKNGGKPVIAVFIADVSGSMNGEPLASLKRSLINAASYIGQEHYIGLISYSNDVTVNLPLAPFDAMQRAYFTGEVRNLSASGSTATYDAVTVGLKLLTEKAEEVENARLMMFLLTDGEQNEGYPLSRIKGIVAGLRVPVYCIAYNYNKTEELTVLSELNESTVLLAESSNLINSLRLLFNSEL